MHGAGGGVARFEANVDPRGAKHGVVFEPCDGAAFGDQRVSHLGFVPIAPLLAAFATPTTIAEALQRVGRDARCFVLPPFAVQQAMRELVQRGWLVSDASAAGSP